MDREPSAIVGYFLNQGEKKKQAEAMAFNGRAAFAAFMEGAALMLDYVGKIEYTYTTPSGNTVHCVLDSP